MLKSYVNKRSVRDKCHAAAQFNISGFMAISVPAGFALIIPRLDVRVSQSVSQTVFCKTKYVLVS